jgi:TonB-dependent SusC/RagA subfamily outer membrane receptor
MRTSKESVRSARGAAAGFERTAVVPSIALAGALLCSGCFHARTGDTAEGTEPEQVNVGFGTQERGNVSGSISSLSPDDLEPIRFASMEKFLVGRVPGLQVLRRGGEVTLRIRGTGEPHVVIDGMASTTRDLLALSPEVVGRIDVRKDGGAGIYGFRAANGVILVTTRRP